MSEIFCTIRRDHPRACGEKFGAKLTGILYTESPPRVRGKVFIFFSSLMLSGITPARAGKSLASSTATRSTAGSPPRVRGKGPKAQ